MYESLESVESGYFAILFGVISTEIDGDSPGVITSGVIRRWSNLKVV
jgi:hypothetical protein